MLDPSARRSSSNALSWRRVTWRNVLSFLLGFVSTPFLITGWYRLDYDVNPLLLWLVIPFVILALSVLFLIFRTRYRALGFGIGFGCLAWAVVLVVLFTGMGVGRPIP